MRPGRIAAALAATAAALLAAAAPEEEPPEPDRWGPLPQELVAVLEAKSAGYRRRALKFTCIEQTRSASYRGDQAGAQDRSAVEYLLVRDDREPGGFRALRSRIGSAGRREVEAEHGFPEPYLWTQLFDPAIRSTLRFAVGSWHTTPYKLAIPIHWRSSAPVATGRRITEWSGTAQIEYRTGNLIEITARPNLQDSRMEKELERYLTAFRILGFSLAAPPVGKELTVRYGYEHEGFTYPTEVELHTFRQVSRTARSTVSRKTVRYVDYRFFGTEIHDEIPPLLFDPRAEVADGR
ncbi:MAG: hypothetical protein D6718_08240 [Acidobacteria bacterium]|nr:MAG: hypothetical protein D6718_08240 [Acidobacteriota bacterium]